MRRLQAGFRPWPGLSRLVRAGRGVPLLPVFVLLCAYGEVELPALPRAEEATVHRNWFSQVGSACRMVVLMRPCGLQASLLWLRERLAAEHPSCTVLAVYAAPSEDSMIGNLEYTTVVGAGRWGMYWGWRGLGATFPRMEIE